MIVRDVGFASEDGAARVSARLDDFELWFRFEAPFEPRACASAFAAAALMPAMRRGAALQLHDERPLSSRLRSGAAGLQQIWASWFPGLSAVAIEARMIAPDHSGEGVFSFFSGGLDGAYTYLEHANDITHLVWFAGMDVRLGNRALLEEACGRAQAFAREVGKPLVVASTNALRLMTRHGLPPHWYHGSTVAALALTLGARRVYVAAGFSHRDLHPWGTHPLTDPLFSTEGCEIVHDGAWARRTEKLRRVAREPTLLRDLRVCAQGAAYNCGACAKCLRTRVALRLLGLDTPALPALRSMDALAGVRICDDGDYAFWRDNLELAELVGDRQVVRALAARLRRYRVRRVLRDLWGAALGRKAP